MSEFKANQLFVKVLEISKELFYMCEKIILSLGFLSNWRLSPLSKSTLTAFLYAFRDFTFYVDQFERRVSESVTLPKHSKKIENSLHKLSLIVDARDKMNSLEHKKSLVRKIEAQLQIAYSLGDRSKLQKSIDDLTELKREIYLSSPLKSLGLEMVSSDIFGAFGHMGLGLDILSMMKDLGELQDRSLFALMQNTQNDCLRNHFSEFLTLVECPSLYSRNQIKNTFSEVRQGLDVFHCETESFYNTKAYNKLSQRIREESIHRNFIRLREDEIALGQEFLASFGLEENDWFVLLHVRESKSRIGTAANASLGDYMDAVDKILDSGGFVFRMGHKGMSKIVERRGYFDYANSQRKSASLDIFLYANCQFLIGTASGPCSIPSPFGRPILYTNAPSWGFTYDQTGFFVPQLIREKKTNKLINIERAVETPLVWSNSEINKSPWERVPNSSQLISNAVNDMLTNAFLSKTTVEEQKFIDIVDQGSLFGRARPAPSFLKYLNEEKLLVES